MCSSCLDFRIAREPITGDEVLNTSDGHIGARIICPFFVLRVRQKMSDGCFSLKKWGDRPGSNRRQPESQSPV